MPGRSMPFITGEYYHVFNKGIAGMPTFHSKRAYDRFLQTIFYYRNGRASVKYSRFLTLPEEEKSTLLGKITHEDYCIDIVSFCLMPNHYHLLVVQRMDRGISNFISNVQNSYTKYVNTRNSREGSLFLNQFKAVRIESEEQCLHAHRYIHINPYTGFVTRTIEELKKYPWSSLPEYLGNRDLFKPYSEPIMNSFNSLHSYKSFIFDQSDYQRTLSNLKHISLE